MPRDGRRGLRVDVEVDLTPVDRAWMVCLGFAEPDPCRRWRAATDQEGHGLRARLLPEAGGVTDPLFKGGKISLA